MSFQTKSIVIGIIISLLIGAASSYFFTLSQINQSRQEVIDLQAEINKLQGEIDDLQEELTSINSQLQRLLTENTTATVGDLGDYISYYVLCPSLALVGQEFKIYFTFFPSKKIYWRWTVLEGFFRVKIYYDGDNDKTVDLVNPWDIWYKRDKFTKVITITPTKEESISVFMFATGFDENIDYFMEDARIPLAQTIKPTGS